MTATLPDVAAKRMEPAEQSAEQQVAAELVRQAREKGLRLQPTAPWPRWVHSRNASLPELFFSVAGRGSLAGTG